MIKEITYILRILFKYPFYTIISLFGMGIALAVCLLTANYVIRSYQYDAFNKNVNRIYRISMEVSAGESTETYATSGKPLGKFLKDNYSGVVSYARLNRITNAKVKVHNDLFVETGVYNVNDEILDVFTFDFLRGNQATCFSNPNTVLLTKSVALKYFNTIDVINKTIQVWDRDYSISGIIEDWPANSHLPIQALLYTNEDESFTELQDWFNLDNYTYILLDHGSNKSDLVSILNQFRDNQLTPYLEGSGIDVLVKSQALSGLYFENGLIDDLPKGNRMYVNALGIAALLILVLSGFNYINLTITQSASRIKEISIKKTLGISRAKLVIQYCTESLIMTILFLTIAALLVVFFAQPYLAYANLSTADLFGDGAILTGIILVSVFLGLSGHSYSGGYLTFSNPISRMKGAFSINYFKRLLVVVQLAITTTLVTAILVINKQVHFMMNTDLGFSKEGIAILNLPGDETLKNKFISFKKDILNNAGVISASIIGSGALPGEENGKELFQVVEAGNQQEKVYNFYRIDADYFDLLNIKFSKGRGFDKNRPSDKISSVVINEALAKSLNWTDPLNRKIRYGETPFKVIGVVKNFHNKSLHNIIEPVVFMYNENYPSNLLVKSNLESLDLVKSEWKKFFPDTPFMLTFFDNFFNAQYRQEEKTSKLFGLFSILALVISGVGLFALFSLNITQKIKEISIRKVLGAGLVNLLVSLGKNYIFLILGAIIVSIPVSWFSMNFWLESFAYRVKIDPGIYIGSTVVILFLCQMVMFYHILKLIRINPALVLKEE